jgi:hypothetical protein
MTFLGLAPSRAVALVDSATGERLTYRDMVRRGREIAGTFSPKKPVVFLVARNDAFSAASYWGALDAGRAVALLDEHAAMEITASLVNVYRPTWARASHRHPGRKRGVPGDHGTPRARRSGTLELRGRVLIDSAAPSSGAPP